MKPYFKRLLSHFLFILIGFLVIILLTTLYSWLRHDYVAFSFPLLFKVIFLSIILSIFWSIGSGVKNLVTQFSTWIKNSLDGSVNSSTKQG